MFSRRESNTQRVTALDAQARSLGLRIGLGVAEARAMHPEIEVTEANPAADLRLLEGLADWCDRYTPLVALDGDEGLYLDISGCAHLFGGEQAMLEDVLARFYQQGFEVHAAIASTPGAAWAAARYNHGRVVPCGDEEALLAPLPLAALRLDAPICAGLESVGLRVAGAILHTPRAPLVRRFGKSVTLRIDQALGHIEESISPRLPVPALMVERHFAEPFSLMEDIEALIAALSLQLKTALEQRGEGAQRLQLQLFRTDGLVCRIGIAISRPLRDPKLIQKLFHEKLNATVVDPGYGFDLVRLAVMSAARFDEPQLSLGKTAFDAEGDLSIFVDRLRARLGEQVITSARMIESHWPEKTAPLVVEKRWPERSVGRQDQCATALRSNVPRPIRLLTAERIEVTAAEIPEGPPRRFCWRSVSYRIINAEGPERIEPEWWQAQKQMEVRDYFRVEDESGRRYWLYREGHYGAERLPRWYLQGLFA